MLIVMKPDAAPQDIERVNEEIREPAKAMDEVRAIAGALGRDVARLG